MPIYPNIYQTLLPGPIVELRGYLAACGLRGRLYAYLNYNGPTGTARDELAEGMLALALERGALTPEVLKDMFRFSFNASAYRVPPARPSWRPCQGLLPQR